MKWMKKKKCNSCDKEQGCSDCKKYQDKAFELEVDEELQQERLAEFWKKYRWLVYGGVASVLLITAGVEFYRNYQIKTRLSESDIFEEATLQGHIGKDKEAISSFEKLASSGKTGYRILALVNLANLQMVKGEKKAALENLKNVLETTSKKDPLHLMVSLSYVGYQLDDGKSEELLKILEPALEDDNFQGLATELAFQLLVTQGKNDDAVTLVKKALANPNISDNLKARLNTLKGE